MSLIEQKKYNLLQCDSIKYITNNLGTETWVTIYNNEYFCFFIPKCKKEEFLNDPYLNKLSINFGMPVCNGNDKENTEYLRYSDLDGFEPLVFRREFSGIKEPYREISEEFRLYHNLYYDKTNNKYIKIDSNGDEEDVIIFKDNNITVKLKYLKQFLAIKDMYLAITFDIKRFSTYSLEELEIKEIKDDYKFNNIIYHFGLVDYTSLSIDDSKSLSRLVGKKLVEGYDRVKCGLWPYEEKEEKYIDFIIGIDVNGEENYSMYNPPKVTDYLTPIFFQKEVLNKYYSDHNKYSVEDGYLRCGYSWALPLDNNNDKYVIAFLGDLWRLSYKEQFYWRSFNVPRDGTISEVCWKRSFMAEFTEPESLNFRFINLFYQFQSKWNKKFNWILFIPLEKGDFYHLQTLRIPCTNALQEFEEQVRGLAKIIIDSINEKEINKFLSREVNGSISKLELFLQEKGEQYHEEHIKFLRDLQKLRSSGIAHRKGTNFQKSEKDFEINEKSLSDIFKNILEKSISFLDYLDKNILESKLNDK